MNPKGVLMKKKIFFVAGLAVSAVAASCFIPLADGHYWWSAWNEPQVTVVDFPDRLPAGSNLGTPVDSGGQDPTLPDEPVDEEPAPVYSGSDKNPTQPTYPEPAAPAPQPHSHPPASSQSCIEQAFVADANSNCTGCVKGVSFSSAYVNSYLNAAYNSPYSLRGNDRKRLAILGILTAGYCSPRSQYQNGYQSSTLIPRLQGSWRDHSLDERSTSWRRNQRGNPLFCSTDAFSEIRKRACETVYRRCNLWSHVDRDCRGVVPDGGDDDDDTGGGGTTGGATTGSTTGSTTGEREVGEGTNDGAGHGNTTGGGNHGGGPPGSVGQ